MFCTLLELFWVVIAVSLRPLATALIITHPVQHPSHRQHSYSSAALLSGAVITALFPAGLGKHCLGVGGVGPSVCSLLPQAAQLVPIPDESVPTRGAAAAVSGGTHSAAGGSPPGLGYLPHPAV